MQHSAWEDRCVQAMESDDNQRLTFVEGCFHNTDDAIRRCFMLKN